MLEMWGGGENLGKSNIIIGQEKIPLRFKIMGKIFFKKI